MWHLTIITVDRVNLNGGIYPTRDKAWEAWMAKRATAGLQSVPMIDYCEESCWLCR